MAAKKPDPKKPVSKKLKPKPRAALGANDSQFTAWWIVYEDRRQKQRKRKLGAPKPPTCSEAKAAKKKYDRIIADGDQCHDDLIAMVEPWFSDPWRISAGKLGLFGPKYFFRPENLSTFTEEIGPPPTQGDDLTPEQKDLAKKIKLMGGATYAIPIAKTAVNGRSPGQVWDAVQSIDGDITLAAVEEAIAKEKDNEA